LNDVERQMIKQALAACGGNKSKAAGRLGITRTQLYVRLRKYRLS
jgi:DNA-binding NtrC family response regulator